MASSKQTCDPKQKQANFVPNDESKTRMMRVRPLPVLVLVLVLILVLVLVLTLWGGSTTKSFFNSNRLS